MVSQPMPDTHPCPPGRTGHLAAGTFFAPLPIPFITFCPLRPCGGKGVTRYVRQGFPAHRPLSEFDAFPQIGATGDVYDYGPRTRTEDMPKRRGHICYNLKKDTA
jgi:hypothetical protein